MDNDIEDHPIDAKEEDVSDSQQLSQEDQPEEVLNVETIIGIVGVTPSTKKDLIAEEILSVEVSDGLHHISASMAACSTLLTAILNGIILKKKQREAKKKPPIEEEPVQAPSITSETLQNILSLMRGNYTLPESEPQLKELFSRSSKSELIVLLSGCNYLEIQDGKDFILNYLATELEATHESQFADFFEIDKDWESLEQEQKNRVYNGLVAETK
jgi:hypothetical protein